jgi:hypothetical protein
MLGAPCSPCCEEQSCIPPLYERIASANVTLTLSGTCETREAVTGVYPAYYHDNGGAPVTPLCAVYKSLPSPVGAWPMAFSPAESGNFFPQMNYATVAFRVSNPALDAAVIFDILGSTGLYQWPGSSCRVNVSIVASQNVVSQYFSPSSLLGSPQQIEQTRNGQTCRLKYYQTDFIEGAFSLVSVVSGAGQGFWKEDKSLNSNAQPLETVSDPRTLFSVGGLVVKFDSQASTANSVRFFATNQGGGFPISRFVPSTSGSLNYPSPAGQPVPDPNSPNSCSWNILAGSLSNTFFVGNVWDLRATVPYANHSIAPEVTVTFP